LKERDAACGSESAGFLLDRRRRVRHPILADLGAEVIKVESRTHPDNLRLSGPHQPGARPLEGSGYFASRNTSKKSIALNMSHPQARQIALTLASRCSIVSNNFRPGVMEKWGLGYDEVAAVNPSVIYLRCRCKAAAVRTATISGSAQPSRRSAAWCRWRDVPAALRSVPEPTIPIMSPIRVTLWSRSWPRLFIARERARASRSSSRRSNRP
jgi:Predicted acyl-CoA transferases/carnitine dehydratase